MLENGDLHFINEIVFHLKLDYLKQTRRNILQFLLLGQFIYDNKLPRCITVLPYIETLFYY